MRRAFVVVQVALSIVLLAGAGLFIRTFREAVAVDLGYAIDRMLLVDITPAEGQPVAASQALYARLGYVEVERRTVEGRTGVFMSKRLLGE